MIRPLRQRRNGPGLVFLLQWGIGLTLTGMLVWLALGSGWIWPAMAIHGGLLTLPAYALSHETAHGTAYRTRWLNEAILWFSSILYMEEPLHRRYTHTNHHTYTWHQYLDSPMPFDLPMTFRIWVFEIAGLSLIRRSLRFPPWGRHLPHRYQSQIRDSGEPAWNSYQLSCGARWAKVPGLGAYARRRR